MVQRIDDGARLTDGLMQCIGERAELEMKYAKGLKTWAKKWEDVSIKGPEYGSMVHSKLFFFYALMIIIITSSACCRITEFIQYNCSNFILNINPPCSAVVTIYTFSYEVTKQGSRGNSRHSL